MSKDLFINGEWVEGKGEALESTNPHSEETLYTCNSASLDQVDEAIKKARQSQQEWREDFSMIDRAEYLLEIRNLLVEKKEELGELVTKECGKEVSEGLADITEAHHMMKFAASLSRHPTGDIIPSEIPSKDSYMRRKPKGVIGCITPWNFPVAIPVWHVAIPLVYGNTVVWKPSEKTPNCGYELAKLFEEVGIPEGVFNLVQGGSSIGNRLVDNENVNFIEFTGSADVGWKITDKIGGNYKKAAALEMGGKNAVVITDKADMDIALHSAIMSSFKTTGQRCVSSERIIVHEDIYDKFKQKFLKAAKSINIGNPLEEDTFMGPLIDNSQREKFQKYNQIAKEEGVNVLLEDDYENENENGYYVAPFIYETEWDNDLKCLQDEVFGPHVSLIKYSGDIERAVQIHNDVDYGLAGSIISEDYRELNYFRDNCELGLAYANLPSIGAEVHLPFGGVKKSGSGHPSGKGVIEACTTRTAWTVNNSKDIELSQGLSSDIKTE